MKSTLNIDDKGHHNFPQVRKAIFMANNLLHNEVFYERIGQCQSFDLSTVSATAIAGLIRNTNITMQVLLYYTLSPLKNYDCYDDGENPELIHLNAWKINRSSASICNTLIHCCVHAVNCHYPEFYFGHSGMSAQENENTAPYRIGAIAQQMASTEDEEIIIYEHDPYGQMIKELKAS